MNQQEYPRCPNKFYVAFPEDFTSLTSSSELAACYLEPRGRHIHTLHLLLMTTIGQLSCCARAAAAALPDYQQQRLYNTGKGVSSVRTLSLVE